MSTLVTNLLQLGLVGGSGEITYDSANVEIVFNRSGKFSGNVEAQFFVGDGSQLTNLSGLTSNASLITEGTLDPDRLATSGVVAGTYGSGIQIPLIVVDNKGRVTSAANTSAASANGASTIVARDAAGSFEANVVTATTFIGDGSQLTGIAGGGGGGDGSGFGTFNSQMSGSVGHVVTTTMTTAYTAPSTAGKRYIVHSVHITNIGPDQADVTAQFSGVTYGDITFADTVPVPVGSSVELLKKPKVMQPSDLLQLQSSLGSTLHATISIQEVSDTTYFGIGADINIGAEFFDLYTAPANSVVESILLSNDDSGILDVKARVVWTDSLNVIQGYFAFDMIVPNDATIELLEQPKFLPSGFKIRVQANQPNRLEAIIAGKTV